MNKKTILSAAAAVALLAGSALASTPAAKPAVKKTATPEQVAANALPAASNVAPTGTPATAAPGSVYAINGFRTATFGMDEAEVRAAIARDLGVAADKIHTETNPMQRTTALTVQTALPPGPGEATVSYIFGAATHRLIHVNVVWATTATPTTADRGAIAAAGLQLANYFRTQPWDPKTPVRAGLVGNGAGLLMFDATDPKGGSVSVEADNIPLSQQVNGKTQSNDPKGAAVLHVSYAQDAAHPDVFAIKPGAF